MYFIKSMDIGMWDLVEYGYDLPKHVLDKVLLPKSRSLWNKDKRKKHLLTFKVRWIIFNFLSSNEYERVFNSTIIKEMWDMLEVAYVWIT